MGKEMETRGFFDLKKQFIFYASYHNDSVSSTIEFEKPNWCHNDSLKSANLFFA